MILIIGVLLLCPGSRIVAEQDRKTPDKATPENIGSAVEIMQKELDIITIHNKGYDKYRKGPVNFSHEKHSRQYGVTCWECHHDYIDGEENAWSPWGTTEKCSKCHDPVEKKDGLITLQTAFHLNCKTCHLEMNVYKDEPMASQTCGKCHVQDVIIENKVYKEDKMGPVAFRHQRHAGRYLNPDGRNIPCEECHHEYIEGENVWREGDTVRNCGTTACHDPLEKKGERQERLRTAYHNNCKVCHRDTAKADGNKNAPYIRCSGCHLAVH